MVFIDSFVFIANIWGLENSKMLFFKWNDTFEQTQFWKVGVVTLKFYLVWQRCMLCKIENGFYWLIYFHCEYLNAAKFGNVVFHTKWCVWADIVFKSGRGQFWNLLTLTEMHSVEDKKWFLLIHLLSLPRFDCSEITKNVVF